MQNNKLDINTPYHAIYDGEIFQKSRCIWHENATMDFFRSLLMLLGYHSTNPNSNKNWKRDDRQVVVCFADDFYTCREMGTLVPPPQIFDRNTVLITDNFVTCATVFPVIQLPDSWFGIYHYVPELSDWTPDRRFHFSVNRIDAKRLRLFLEIVKRTLRPNEQGEVDLDSDLNVDYMNFNCWSWQNASITVEELQFNFSNEFQKLFHPTSKAIYEKTFNLVAPRMPLRNHPWTLEQAQMNTWLNIVIETYSEETSIALSEKIFRALVTPMPWVVYAGKYTVSYLRRLGFDVLDDLVNHRSDNYVETHTGRFGDKMVDFVHDANNTVNELKNKDFAQIKARCQQAADHNQQLLLKMRQQWPDDFARWLPSVVNSIK